MARVPQPSPPAKITDFWHDSPHANPQATACHLNISPAMNCRQSNGETWIKHLPIAKQINSPFPFDSRRAQAQCTDIWQP